MTSSDILGHSPIASFLGGFLHIVVQQPTRLQLHVIARHIANLLGTIMIIRVLGWCGPTYRRYLEEVDFY